MGLCILWVNSKIYTKNELRWFEIQLYMPLLIEKTTYCSVRKVGRFVSFGEKQISYVTEILRSGKFTKFTV